MNGEVNQIEEKELCLILGALLIKLFQYYKWSFVKFLYEDTPKPWHECQVLLRPIAHTFSSNQIRSDNRKVTSHDINDGFKSIFVDFISNNASGKRKLSRRENRIESTKFSLTLVCQSTDISFGDYLRGEIGFCQRGIRLHLSRYDSHSRKVCRDEKFRIRFRWGFFS